MTEIIVSQFKKQILGLIDDLQEIFPKESDLLLIRLYLDNAIPEIELIEGFEKWVYPWKDKILAKNDIFFKDNDHAFGPLPKNKVEKIKNMWFSNTFDKDDKEVLWAYFQVYIKLIEKYKKLV